MMSSREWRRNARWRQDGRIAALPDVGIARCKRLAGLAEFTACGLTDALKKKGLKPVVQPLCHDQTCLTDALKKKGLKHDSSDEADKDSGLTDALKKKGLKRER